MNINERKLYIIQIYDIYIEIRGFSGDNNALQISKNLVLFNKRKMPHTTKNDDAGRYMIGIKEMRK